MEQQNKEADDLRHQLKLEIFAVTRFCHDDTLISFYTGFKSYGEYVTFFQCIEPTAQHKQSAYYQGGDTLSLAGRKRSMLLIDELFLFLCRLHMGLLEQDLSVRFSISIPTVSRKIVAWGICVVLYFGKHCNLAEQTQNR